MKQNILILKSDNPSTLNGYTVQVQITYSSFQKEEIDKLYSELRDKYGEISITSFEN